MVTPAKRTSPPQAKSPTMKDAAPHEGAVDLTSAVESSSPAMPHERDEAAGMTDGAPSSAVQQGHRDLERGLEDTSRAPEADKAYRKLKK